MTLEIANQVHIRTEAGNQTAVPATFQLYQPFYFLHSEFTAPVNVHHGGLMGSVMLKQIMAVVCTEDKRGVWVGFNNLLYLFWLTPRSPMYLFSTTRRLEGV